MHLKGLQNWVKNYKVFILVSQSKKLLCLRQINSDIHKTFKKNFFVGTQDDANTQTNKQTDKQPILCLSNISVKASQIFMNLAEKLPFGIQRCPKQTNKETKLFVNRQYLSQIKSDICETWEKLHLGIQRWLKTHAQTKKQTHKQTNKKFS